MVFPAALRGKGGPVGPAVERVSKAAVVTIPCGPVIAERWISFQRKERRPFAGIALITRKADQHHHSADSCRFDTTVLIESDRLFEDCVGDPRQEEACQDGPNAHCSRRCLPLNQVGKRQQWPMPQV